MNNFKLKKFFVLIFIITLFIFSPFLFRQHELKAQILENPESDCVICAQFVPECGPDEELVNQTCKECAHCVPKSIPTPSSVPSTQEESNCQKCTIHSQCSKGYICTNDCCTLKPNRKKNYKKPECIVCPQSLPKCKPSETLAKQNCFKCARCIPKKTLPKKSLSKKIATNQIKPSCKNPCGRNCCTVNEKCITIDQCKGKKKCRLPILKYCSSKEPEKLHGKLN